MSTVSDSATIVAPGDAASAQPRPGRRWSSFAHWIRTRAPELGIAFLALVFFAWGLSKNGYANTYYAAAARSMTVSWKNFLYGAFDPGGWITTDKPPLALWLESGSARLFGLSSVSLLAPSVACGVASVWLLMATVRRAWGAAAGRVAGIALAVTPVFLAVTRSNNPDVTLVLCLVGAAYATQRAVRSRRPVWLVLAGVLCGVGFLAKLLVAGVIMPGLWLAYLLTGPRGWWRRVRDVAIASVAFVLVAGAWVALIDLTPASQRPYVGNSTNNTAQSVVFGYDGFGRLTGSTSRPGGQLRGPAAGFRVAGPRGGGGGGARAGVINQSGGPPGIGRLFNAGMGDQVMWLAVVAAVALLAGLVVAVRRRRRDAETASLVLFGGWLGVSYLVFAFTQGTFHNYYVAALAPAVAGLVGIGFELARRGGRLAAGVVAVSAAGTAALQLILLRRVAAYEWLRVAVPVGLVVVALAAAFLAFRPRRFRWALGAVAAAGLVVALVAPAAWSVAGVRHPENGTNPAARPAAATSSAAFSPGVGGGGPGTGGGFGGAGVSPAELAWLRGQRTPRNRWILAVPSARQAEQPIIDGDSVMAMGGFQGTDPAMTRAKLAGLVATGALRFVAPSGTSANGSTVPQAVAQLCTPVSAAQWGQTAPSGVYDCRGKAAALRTARVSAATPAPGSLRLGSASAVDKLVACFAQHGVNVSAGAPPLSDPKFQAALKACAPLIPAALDRGIGSHRRGPPPG
jgi:4-amino-4-deoxy-L-arabinose transferase-like glycosyltransferase